MQSAILRSLARATRDHPHDRKILVCGNRQYGRELLRALSVSGTPWLAWEVTTPGLLALELVHAEMAGHGESVADEFRIMRLVDDAIDAAIAAGNTELRAAVGSASFRDALHRAVALLRASGRVLDVHTVEGRILRATVAVLHEYEARLAAEQLLDRADVLGRALRMVESGERASGGARVFLLPSSRFGLRGQLLETLLRVGAAELLESECVHGLEPQDGLLRRQAETETTPLAFLHAPESAAPLNAGELVPELFAAATPMDELREVLRRVAEKDLPWDQVEIVATDTRTYGNALYALARRFGIPLTMANGIDFARTRTGRAVRGYLAWLRDSFPAESFRIMLETGDLTLPEVSDMTGARLSSRLRRLRIGWGKQRYVEAIDRALIAAMSPTAPNDEREAQEAEQARERERQELQALRSILAPILEAAPNAPARLGARESWHSPAAIARGLIAFLDHVASGDESDTHVRDLVRERLERAATELTRRTGWETALTIVERCADLRASPDDDGMPAWTSAPGRLHFSDLRGGQAARAHTFVVGLDASRVAANAGVDPILTDRARRDVLGLPTSRDRAALRRYELAELLASLTGSVTLSFSAWDATEGRAVPPAMELLQALRLAQRNDSLTYNDLHRAIGPLASAVPRRGGRLDAGDVWLAALTSESGMLHRATRLVEAAYPHLARGQLARRAREEPRFNAHHGQLRRAASASHVFSATQLEALGTCPRRYLYRYVFKVEPPDRIDFDPEKWLDPLERGSLLHHTYEQALRRARQQGVDYAEREFWNLAANALRESIALTRDRLPPPGEEVYQREVRDLAEDLRRFVKMLRKHRPDWLELEYRFGGPARELVVDTLLGPMRLRGAIDRVDQLDDDKLLVVDYKTGRKYGYWPSRPYNGGRRIQHVVYSLAAARLLGREVSRMEYHFPTLRGQNEIVHYWTRQLGSPAEALGRLHSIAAGNVFPTTDDPRDCRFCDFASVCRVQIDAYGRAESPLATWSKEHGLAQDEGRALRNLRTIDG